MKKILLLITAILILIACKKKNTPDTLLIDTEHVSVEGSFVQGTINSELCKTVIPYANANGGSCEVSADEVNGCKIEKQTVALSATGEIKVNIAGTPFLLNPTFLQVQVKYQNKTYITSVEIPIASDPNPNGEVTFTIDQTPIVGLNAPKTLTFTVDPTMAAVVNTSATPIIGLRVAINSNPTTGQGTVTLTPDASFMGGTVQLTAQFGARPTQVANIPVSYFATGDGKSAATAFPITDAISLAKVQYGTATQYFKVMNDFEAGTWTPMASFNTNLDGNAKTITYTTNTPTADSVALIKKINGGSITNLTLTGFATGKNLVAGLATWSNTAITGVTSTVVVTGSNNLANLVASGTGKDASTLVVTALPTLLNVLDPATTGTATLGVTPTSVAVAFSNNLTMATFAYSAGIITATMPSPTSNFVPGNINYAVTLSATDPGSFVHLAQQTMAISFSKPFESGTGIVSDPYIVIDGMGLNQTMSTYPDSYIKVKNDITVTSWTTVPTFSGNLDGQTFKVSGLDKPMIATLTGTVKNIKLVTAVAGITVTTGGILANVANQPASISYVGVSGNLTGTTSPIGGIVGEVNNTTTTSAVTIDNCYYNGTITTSASATGGIVGRAGFSTVQNSIIISNCTSVGEIKSTTGSPAQIGGILGRIANGTSNNGSTLSTYTIRNCNSSMTINTGNTNLVGGIFGALQYSITTGTKLSILKIDQCLFTGKVSTVTGGSGGISSVGGWITNCMVVGQKTTPIVAHIQTNGLSSQGSSSAGIVSGAKDVVENCIVIDARMTGASTTVYAPAGIVSNRNGGATTLAVTNCVVLNSAVGAFGRTIIGYNSSTAMGANYSTTSSIKNYYSGVVDSVGTISYTKVGNTAIDGDLTTDALGANKDVTQQAFWTDPTNFTTPYDFTTIWDWDAANSRPKLRNVGCAASVIP